MNKKLLAFFLALLIPLLFPFKAQSQGLRVDSCSQMNIGVIEGLDGTYIKGSQHRIVLDFSRANNVSLSTRYKVVSERTRHFLTQGAKPLANSGYHQIVNSQLDVNLDEYVSSTRIRDSITAHLFLHSESSGPVCYIGEYTLAVRPELGCTDLRISQDRTINGQNATCYRGSCFDEQSDISISCQFTTNGAPTALPNNTEVVARQKMADFIYTDATQGDASGKINLTMSPLARNGSRIELLFIPNPGAFEWLGREILFSYDVSIYETCNQNDSCVDKPALAASDFELCSQINSSTPAYSSCVSCVGSSTDPHGLWTAIGCIPTDAGSIIKVAIKIGLLAGGGIALLIIIAAAFSLSISQGDPKKTSEAKDTITAAVIGLIFIIFSISILQFIGVNVLQIPGFFDQ